jgi:hypothetical protein
MNGINYRALDPGIREVVRWLRDHGFNTTDSGDGVTKFAKLGEDACALRFPNAFMTVDSPRQLCPEADRLAALLAEAGVTLGHRKGQPVIEASYSPAGGACIIALYGLDDAGLAKATRRNAKAP